MTETPEIFVDLLDATIRSSRNYHRLDHCSYVEGVGPKSVFRFKEETITDLLIGELAGKEYDVSGRLPGLRTRLLVPTGTAIPTAASADSKSGP